MSFFQAGQALSCTAASAKRLITEGLAHVQIALSDIHHPVAFPPNLLQAAIGGGAASRHHPAGGAIEDGPNRSLDSAPIFCSCSPQNGPSKRPNIKAKIRISCAVEVSTLLRGNPICQRPLGRTFNLENDVRGSAYFSDCGNYRPYLSRAWAEGPTIMWLCMNPSSATNILDDATSRKLTRHSRRLGFGKLFLLNVMDYRATDPADLPQGEERSPQNLNHIERCARHADRVVLAYGGLRKKPVWTQYADEAVEACQPAIMFHAADNEDGSPRHPRRFPANFELALHEYIDENG